MKRTKRVTALIVGVAMLISQLTMPEMGKRALAAYSDMR